MEHDVWEEFQDINYKLDAIIDKLGINKEETKLDTLKQNEQMAEKLMELANQFKKPEPEAQTPIILPNTDSFGNTIQQRTAQQDDDDI